MAVCLMAMTAGGMLPVIDAEVWLGTDRGTHVRGAQ
jgi:hypothetical protein